MRRSRNPLDDGGLVALLATPEHRGTIGKVQSLMTLLEGHGNRVMNELGARHVRGQARMARVLEARRSRGGTTGFFHKLIGLEAKLRQYEVGEAFVAAIEAQAGPRAIDPAWRGPEWLPAAEELEDPSRWLARVA
jgi:putative hydrolase